MLNWDTPQEPPRRNPKVCDRRASESALALSMHPNRHMEKTANLAQALAAHVRPLNALMSDFDPLLELVGDARCVLIGEASHGTHDFYRQRAQLTKRLIVEKGFDAVAAEADWPDAHRVNRYVRGLGRDTDAVEALNDFQRFPAWMWRNADVLDFVGWLRDFNDARGDQARPRRVLRARPLQPAYFRRRGLVLLGKDVSEWAVT